jgi:TPP-dependent pyruvate/acetoin dehydrogenase alpha subunit
MVLIRRFEEKSAELYTGGKIRGFLHLYIDVMRTVGRRW